MKPMDLLGPVTGFLAQDSDVAQVQIESRKLEVSCFLQIGGYNAWQGMKAKLHMRAPVNAKESAQQDSDLARVGKPHADVC
jgi:hypothetical protein